MDTSNIETANPDNEAANSEVEFVFRGGPLALDLINTEVMVRGKRGDLLTTPLVLEKWWQAIGQQYPESPELATGLEAFSPTALEAVLKLRRALRNIMDAVVNQAAIDPQDQLALNTVLAIGHHHLTLQEDNKRLKAEYQLNNQTDSSLLFQVALSAFRLLTETELKRLHRCKNERCILYFYDNTRSATRHWCSLGCMNRSRSLENYRRAKQLKSHE